MTKSAFRVLGLAGAAMLASMSMPAHAGNHGQSQNVVQKAASLDDFSTLVTAVKAADLAGTLSSKGPFTVFAPNNAAFAKLPSGTVSTLVKPENKATLQSILTYHVLAGRVTGEDILSAINLGGGSATLFTVQGGALTATLDSHGSIVLIDAKGGRSKVKAADISQSNGVIHVIDTVVMPG
ncbi:fasciclin domain-containing protein [Alterisphingorhabdus coralli]|uniref:Fasciclin domain-containing protein n=1 Tax=Alterisphingorhabdus coralli TaxID=3071408 RepID=A0AA97I0P9_9SPHN|nr:fasciclin domain-containing protein [Parasphingorhabdus sp. SCSIO 66989]WOE73985.1 fasciclin domain-containing protein [Parasphingorhabdus sp. SCSIO 66989]